MELTLGEVLRYDVLENSKMLTKNHDPNRLVSGISIMEAPDILNWMEGNEIILTSLYAIKDDETKMKDLIASFYEKEVAALIVKTKRFFDQVPEEIITAAEELRFAVVEIPVDVRFTDIMYPVMAAVFDSQVIKLSYFKQTRNLLTGLALKNAGIKGIAEAFHEIVKNPVVIYDHDERLLFSTMKTMEFINPERIVRLPITVLEYVTGYLGVYELNHPLSELDLIAMENAIAVLSLEMLKEFTVSEAERSFKLEMIEDIIAGKNRYNLLEQAKNINWNLEKKYAVCVIQFSHTEQASPLREHLAIGGPSMTIGSIIRSAMQRSDLKGIAEAKKHTAMVFVEQPASSHQLMERLEEFFNQVARELLLSGQIQTLNLGYSSHFCQLVEIPQHYQNAQYALKIGRILYGPDVCCDFESLGVFKLLCLAEKKDELVALVPASLRILSEYDKTNSSGLVETLEAFFSQSRNANRAASILFIHPKTMAYRLHKIQELTGLDMKSPSEMLELEMGVNILKVFRDEDFWTAR